MNKDIFEKARASISAGLVESILQSPGAYWSGGEYWTLNPCRSDSKVGSFSISETGLYNDFSSGDNGDLIDLICARDNCTKKEAAETIIKESGGVIPDQQAKALKPSKPDPVYPVSEEDLKKLNGVTRSEWAKKNIGYASGGWVYRDAQGRAMFCTVRYDKSDGGKDIIPYYWTGSAWRQGQAMKQERPLYGLNRITEKAGAYKILIVEGEKCADIDVAGYQLTTWIGGTNAIKKTDFSPLADLSAQGVEVVIWPDNDEPGNKVAETIKNLIPGSVVMQIPTDKPKGWDIADAAEEGYILPDFIEKCTVAEDSEEDEELSYPRPYRPLGSDGTSYYFLVHADQSIFQIQKGQFTSSRICELAPLSYWTQFPGFISENGNSLRPLLAQNQLQEECYRAGRYDERNIRCSGFWRDNDEIILNDGYGLIKQSTRERVKYRDYRSKYIYQRSTSSFPDMHGETATKEEGERLLSLFKAQRFIRPELDPIFAAGWALIAPFSGSLPWRPHLWITGRKGSGKSWFIEQLMKPMCEPFLHSGTGGDTSAAIRRTLDKDAKPVILDEMESKNKQSTEKIGHILDLARNACSDGSAPITITGADGKPKTYMVRSAFCFASINIPEADAAIQSRIKRIELKALTSAEQYKKEQNSTEHIDAITEPHRYVRRTFEHLHDILQDIEWFLEAYATSFKDRREADLIAPLLCAAWHAISDETLRESESGHAWIGKMVESTLSVDASDELVEDEDRLLSVLMSRQLMTDQNEMRSISELLTISETPGEASGKEVTDLLSRHGIKKVHKGEADYLAIHSGSESPVAELLKNSAFGAGYKNILARHPAAVDMGRKSNVRFKFGQGRSIFLLWEEIEDQFIDKDDPDF